MLRGIHKASANWLGRVVMGIVLGLIAISFSIWGIGDIFRGFGQSTVAKVGRTEISIEQFRQIYNDRLQELSRRAGRPITPDQARLFGIDRQILGQLIAETTLDERARDLGLGIPEAEIAKRITEDPSFRGIDGRFDHARFLQIIRQAGFTEPRYFAEQRRIVLRQQLISAVSGEVSPPKSSLEAFNRYQNEQRAIEYVQLNQSQAGQIPAPPPEVLNKYYEERKVLFRAPEYRKLLILALTPTELAANIQVSDDDIKAAYERYKSRYVTPERRRVQQILFQSTDEARAASDRLNQGTPFATLANEPGIKERYTDLGLVAKTSMADPAIGEAAFALKVGGPAGPIEGRFGTALIFVDRIEPGKSEPLEKVSPDLKKEIAQERASRDVQATRDKVEDERLDGKNLEQTAQKLNLKLRTIEAVDRSGRGPDGKPITDLPQGTDVLSAAFTAEAGVENESLSVQGGGHVWFDVVSITPSRDRPLDEIKAQVETRWRDDEIATKLKSITTEMLDKLKAGTTMAQIASANKLKLETKNDLKRGVAVPGFPLRALGEVFRTAKGAPGAADGEAATDRIVYRVTNITVPAFDPAAADTKQIDTVLKRALNEDLVTQYLARIQNDIGVTINQTALNQVTGGSRN